MKGIYRKRFSSGDIKNLWKFDGAIVDLVPLTEGVDEEVGSMYTATFPDGTTAHLFSDEVDVVD